MYKIGSILLSLVFLFSCGSVEKMGPDEEVLASLGGEVKRSFLESEAIFETQLLGDSSNLSVLTELAETRIILYIFGFSSREETIPGARAAYLRARELDPGNSKVILLGGMLDMLDWKWKEAEFALRQAIQLNPGNLNARHWYSLYLSAMGDFDLAMAQSDTIMGMDPDGQFLIGRGSLHYFARDNVALRDLMIKEVAKDTTVAWGYDWLGMAYCELEDFENSVEIYHKAFRLSDGTVEVGGGLGHALGLAGYYEAAKQMADFYSQQSKDHYLPPVQRSFIHIGIEEYDEAIRLLEQAYDEHSWFLAFIQIEPWYDPIRKDPRFQQIIERMLFP